MVKPTAAASDSRSPARERGRIDDRGRGDCRGRGRGNGRDKDSRGRGRGRFVAPTGAAFFTGASTKQLDVNAPIQQQEQQQVTITTVAAGQDGAVVLPFTKSFSNEPNSSRVARTAAESMAAAARARLGEGEEIIVAEMDVQNEIVEDKNASVSQKSSKNEETSSLFDDENVDEMLTGFDSNYVYDSDSSEEEQRTAMQNFKGKENDMRPIRLPFPLALSQSTPMYACQENAEEKENGVERVVSSMAVSQLADPEVTSPFLDWSSRQARDELKFSETNSWFLMKFPTRLPHLDQGSLVRDGLSKQTGAHHSGGGGAVKTELNEEGLEVIGSNTEVGDNSNATVGSNGELGMVGTGNKTVGYDNTLKDVAPGKYGKIVVYKSGRTELVVGGDNGDAEVRAKSILYNDLALGFAATNHAFLLGSDVNQRGLTLWL